MRKRTKLFSVGIFVIIISLVFINSFSQLDIMTNRSNLGSIDKYPTFGNADTQFTIIYGDPTELTVQKTESITIELYPNGSIKSQRVTVNFLFENAADENCSFDLIDRAEYCDLDSIRVQRGTFATILPYEVIKSDEDFGVTVLKWSNISLNARSSGEFGYAIASYKPVPISVETEYWVNGTKINIDPLKNEINASVGSFVSNIIRLKNIQQELYSTYEAAKPPTICLITLILPFEEEEENRDIDEPIYSTAPIMSSDILSMKQVSWIALGDEYEVNWSTTVLSGGGWGIIELQPIRIDLIQSSEITGVLFDGLSALLGLLAAQQAYWASLTLMAMIDELMGMVGIFELLLNDIQTYLGMLSMVNYSLINCLLISLVELDMTKTSLQEIYNQLYDIYDDIEFEFGYFGAITSEFRTILGMLPEGATSNGLIGLGIPYMSIPLLLDYYEDVERRIIASFGAQLIELLGSPAFINMTSTEDDYYIIINATVTQMPDNSTDFYTLIDIANLSLPIAFGYSLNLTQQFEFQLNVPLDRAIFEYIDEFFGSPVIPFDMFPSIPSSPESNMPGFYTWVLDILRIGQSALWATIGNLTRSLATLMLLLDSSFSQETLQLLNATLTGSGVVDPTTPITLETGFAGLSNLMGIFSGMEEQFNSPFGNPFAELMPSTSSIGIPSDEVDISLLENFGFWTALKIYLYPVPRMRQTLNITLPLNLGNMTADSGSGGVSTAMGGIGFIKSAENGQMNDWDNLTTVTPTQTNQLEGSTTYKRIRFNATSAEDNETIILLRDFNQSFPATRLTYRLRINNPNPILSIVAISKNASGDDVYAIQVHNFSDLTLNTWHEISYDLRLQDYWEYKDESFDPENIKAVELRITPNTISPVNLDIDFLNFTREVVPYPYDIQILDGYLIGDGVEILPNITILEKWTDGLMITDLEIAEMTGDGVNDVIAGSNDGYIYLLNGLNGLQIWNLSVYGSILEIFLEDISGDSSPEIIIGTKTGYILIINKTRGILSQFFIGQSLDYLLCGNLGGTGNSELIAVNENNITAVDYYGNVVWNRTLKSSIQEVSIDDINGDAKDEIGVATYKYKVLVLNGTNGVTIWNHTTEERPTHLEIGNFWGDANKELIYSTDQDYCVVLDGIQGNHLYNFTIDSIIRGIYTANFTNNGYDDVLLHTGLITGENLAAFAGNTFNLLWNLTTPYGFSAITSSNILNDNLDEVITASVTNQVYVLDNSGNVLMNFTSPRSINIISMSELTEMDQKEFIFGIGNNYILALNGTSQEKLWMSEMGIEIVTFQFTRTNETIQLYYNLADFITNMLGASGLSLTGTDDLASLASFDIGTGMDGLGGIDLSNLNLTGSNLPLTGLGLINMLQMEITLIAALQDTKLLSSSQRAFTGVHEVRYVAKDTTNFQLYPIITDDTNAKYIQYKLRNLEEYPMTIHYFGLNLTVNGQPINEARISIEGWNGTHFIDLGNNPMENISMAELGIDYADGKLLFKPHIQLEDLEKALLTVDWLGRELRVKINTIGLNPNDLSIETWVDVSIELPGIEIPGITSIITYSKTHPTWLVTAVPLPEVRSRPDAPNILYLMLMNPAFWALFTVGFATLFVFGYMKKREQKEVKTIAAKKVIKWMKNREKSWSTLVKATLMTESQYNTLRRIRYRIRQENLVQHPIETMVNNVFNWKLIGTFISTALLRRFWRGVNKPSRLIWIIAIIEQIFLSPLKHAYSSFKTALGYLNPWDMNRQRKKELRKKAQKKNYWKKIEPPRKPIRKKRVEIFTSPPSTPPKLKYPLKKTKKGLSEEKQSKDQKIKYLNDGGTLLKKISSAKKLPSFVSQDGQVFYTISKRKFVGITLKEISKTVDIPEYEILVSLIRLYEKGLILLLQEGDRLSNDLWDVAISLRKLDSEIEKLIDSAETLELEIDEGIEFLSNEVENNKKSE